ncbi:MAG: cytochrome b/b6 domain-containing protein [Wenzhouxiangellaceae bacterium]|nr:cytochrome b/b6 domain-containing protein [Wenzhouxiangellaceae bacterium]
MPALLQSIGQWLDRCARLAHWLIASLSLWLILTSPWISMRRIVPKSAGVLDLAHIGLGLALAGLVLAYLVRNSINGRWRQYFPWLVGRLPGVGRDLAGTLRGKLPSPDGAGLLALLEGLLLVALLVTALSGIGWLLADGSRAALGWRELHSHAAWSFSSLLLLHLVAGVMQLGNL